MAGARAGGEGHTVAVFDACTDSAVASHRHNSRAHSIPRRCRLGRCAAGGMQSHASGAQPGWQHAGKRVHERPPRNGTPFPPAQVGVTKPHFYGTHDWRDSLPPRLPPYEQILL